MRPQLCQLGELPGELTSSDTASEEEFLEQHLILPPTCAKLTDFLAPFPLSMAIVKAAVRAEACSATPRP